MSRVASQLALVASCIAGLGCGSPSPPPAPVAALPDRPKIAANSAKPQARMDAAPEPPEDLKMVLRVNDAEQLRNEIAGFVPAIATVFGSFDVDALVALAIGEELAAVVDATQPIDAALLGPSEAFLLSFAVKADAEPNLRETFELEEARGISLVTKARSAQRASLQSCGFVPSAGRPALRLVCAKDAKALRSAAHYLARSVAAEPLDTDIRLTVAANVFREERAGKTKSTDDTIVSGLFDAFVRELDRLDVDVKFAGARVDAALETRFNGRESLLGRALVSKGARGAIPPPPGFYRLPKDAVFAMYLAGTTPEDVKPLKDALLADFHGSMQRDGYADDKVKSIEDQLSALFLTGGPIVVGAGIGGGIDGAEKALAAIEGARDPKKAEAQARTALVAWSLAWVDEPALRWTQGFRELVKRGDEAEKTRKPEIAKAAAPKDPDGENTKLRIGKLDPKLKLPEGTLHVEVEVTPRKKGGTKVAHTGHLFIVPKGSSTWLAYGEDPSTLALKVRFAIDDAETRGTIAELPEAAALAKEKSAGAGVASLGGVALLLADGRTSADLVKAAGTAKRTSGLQGRGRDVIAWTASSDATPGRVRLGVRTSASRAAIRDLVSYLVH